MTTVAIDFGTSNTVVSVVSNDTRVPESLRIEPIAHTFSQRLKDGNTITIPVIPSLVYIRSHGDWVLGKPVQERRLDLKKEQQDRLFKAFKRELVADFQSPPRLIDGIAYTPEMVCEGFLKALWHHLKQKDIHPTRGIFTVPVEAFERYLDWFRDLGPKLGLQDLQIVDESTAAALGYAVARPGSLVLVIDFGGGTLDLSIVRTSVSTPGSRTLKAEVIAKSGAYLGGEDIDRWIVEDYLRRQGLTQTALQKMAWQALLSIAEKAKIKLSQVDNAQEQWLDEETFTAYAITLTRNQFEELLEEQQFLEQLRQNLDEVLACALNRGISKNDLEKVLLTGGSSLIPAVQQLVLSYFGRQKVALHKPFEAVCHGALYLSRLAKIEDYLRHSYVLRLWNPQIQGYIYHPLFETGIKYPCQRPDPLVLQVANANQREIRLDIGELATLSQAEVIYDAQGRLSNSELHHQQNFRSLEAGHQQVCIAKLDPPGEQGTDRILAYFEVNQQRVLLATVHDLLTNQTLAHRVEVAKLE